MSICRGDLDARQRAAPGAAPLLSRLEPAERGPLEVPRDHVPPTSPPRDPPGGGFEH